MAHNQCEKTIEEIFSFLLPKSLKSGVSLTLAATMLGSLALCRAAFESKFFSTVLEESYVGDLFPFSLTRGSLALSENNLWLFFADCKYTTNSP